MKFRKIASALDSYYFRLTKWMVIASSVFIGVIVVYTTGDVGGRYLANNPLPATFEITVSLMVFLVFLSLAHTQAIGEHIRLDFLGPRLKPRGRAISDGLSILIGLFLLALIVWQNWDYTWSAWQTKELMQGVWKIPYFPSRFALTLGAFLLWIQYLIDFIRFINQPLREVGEARNSEQ